MNAAASGYLHPRMRTGLRPGFPVTLQHIEKRKPDTLVITSPSLETGFPLTLKYPCETLEGAAGATPAGWWSPGDFHLAMTSYNQMSLSALPTHPFLPTRGVRHSCGTPRGLPITRLAIWDLLVGRGRGQERVEHQKGCPVDLQAERTHPSRVSRVGTSLGFPGYTSCSPQPRTSGGPWGRQ